MKTGQNLAKYGRHGDTEIRNIDGEPSHVNLLEAYMIDNQIGKEGEEWAKRVGSGTINPITGKKEHFWPAVALFAFGSAVVGGLRSGGRGGVGGLWDYSLGKHGVGGYLGDKWFGGDEKKARKKQAKKITGEGMTGLGEELESYMGTGDADPGPDGQWGTADDVGSRGFLQEQRDITETGLQSDFDYTTGGLKSDLASAKSDYGYTTGALGQQVQADMSGIKSAGYVATAQTGLATSGTLQQQISGQKSQALGTYGLGMDRATAGLKTSRGAYGRGMTKARSDYDIGMDTASLTYDKSAADVKGNIKEKINKLIMDYQGATEEAYDTSGGEYQDLMAMLEQYA